MIVSSRWGVRGICALLSNFSNLLVSILIFTTGVCNQDKMVLKVFGFFSIFSFGGSML